MLLINVYGRRDRHQLLFDLLSERDETTNISHRAMPAWDDHVKFVESRPYDVWDFIEVWSDHEMQHIPVGACYLTRQNEIGVFVFRKFQGSGYGPAAIRRLMEKSGPRRYLANINPHNDRSQSVFAALGFNLCQLTYEYRGT